MSEDEPHHYKHKACSAGAHGTAGISCQEISEFLLAFFERELDSEVHARFERHLQLCPPCGNYLDGYRDTVALVRSCGKAEAKAAKSKHRPPPEDLVQAILSAKALLDGDC